MASVDLDKLYDKYEGFYYPRARVYLAGKDISDHKKLRVKFGDFRVEVTSELKAGIASFSVFNAYDYQNGTFRTKDLKPCLTLGTDVKILMGHADTITEVFKGYIARVDFSYDADGPEGAVLRVTAMDIKGIMMANNSSKRLKANYYCDAVKEILDQQFYNKLKDEGIIDSITIANTPDKPEVPTGPAPDVRIEMVSESDYEFVTKVARKFNYEFFTVGGNLVFRKAKANTQDLAVIHPSKMVLSFDVGYDITGVVGNVVVRTLDIGKASKVEVKVKNPGKLSIGNKAKPLVAAQSYVYIDSAVETQKDAENRANYIMEDIAYRLGSISMTLNGMPEMVPGRFVKLQGFGDGISNKYYITDVIHRYDNDGQYTTTIVGKASTMQ